MQGHGRRSWRVWLGALGVLAALGGATCKESREVDNAMKQTEQALNQAGEAMRSTARAIDEQASGEAQQLQQRANELERDLQREAARAEEGTRAALGELKSDLQQTEREIRAFGDKRGAELQRAYRAAEQRLHRIAIRLEREVERER